MVFRRGFETRLTSAALPVAILVSSLYLVRCSDFLIVAAWAIYIGRIPAIWFVVIDASIPSHSKCLPEGVQLVLFCICAYVLIKRRRPSQLVLLLVVTIMFSLATVDLAISFRMIVDDLPTVADSDSSVALAHLYPKNPLYVTNK